MMVFIMNGSYNYSCHSFDYAVLKRIAYLKTACPFPSLERFRLFQCTAGKYIVMQVTAELHLPAYPNCCAG